MRRIFSMLLIARMIQRLVNGSRGRAIQQSRPSRQPEQPTEPPQGGPAAPAEVKGKSRESEGAR